MRRLVATVALAFLITCAPTALPRPDSSTPNATAQAIASSDLITLREGGQQPSLVVRKVSTGEVVRTLPDGILLPGDRMILSVESGGATTRVKKIDRRSGDVLASSTIEGTWQLHLGANWFTTASADGSHLVLTGSSYNFTDQSGTWTARTTFGLVDIASWRIDAIQLDGRYTFQAVSNDGRSLYLTEYNPVQLPNESRLRVYDVATRGFADVTGEPAPSLSEAFRMTTVGRYAFALVGTTETLHPSPDMTQVMPVTKVARVDLSSRTIRTLRLPVSRAITGEDVFMWSLVASRDQRIVYIANPAAGSAYEVEAGSLEIRRTAQLNDAKSQRGALDAALAYLHPVAEAKMGFGTPAVLSPDGATLYVLAAKGIWSFDLASFKAKMLTRDGAYETVAISPDGARLYVLGREDGIVRAIDAKTGKLLGSMTRLAFPSEIVAVDAA